MEFWCRDLLGYREKRYAIRAMWVEPVGEPVRGQVQCHYKIKLMARLAK